MDPSEPAPDDGLACSCAAPAEPSERDNESGDTGPWVAFDDTILTQNQPTDSPIFPITDKNRALLSGVLIAATAFAIVTFVILVSVDGENWTQGGTSLNVSTPGYFSNSASIASGLNARFLKVRASTGSAASVSLWATVAVARY
jgi:hypothetical protein